MDPSNKVIKEQAELLSDSYPNDVSKDDLEEELHHFVNSFQALGALSKRNQALEIINLINEKNLNVCICLRIFLSIPVSVASRERSFSKLALIKDRLRSMMSRERPNSLMLLPIQHKLARTLDLVRKKPEKYVLVSVGNIGS